MKSNRKLKRYIIAVILLIISAYRAIFIKDTVDAQNPENSLPIINVSVGYTYPYVVRAGYTWQFGLKTVRSPFVDCVDVPLVVSEVSPRENIVITFSKRYDYLTVSQADGTGAIENEAFSELMYSYVTPAQEGIYTYKVEAHFDKGDILYYFAVQVKNGTLIQ